MRADWTLPPVDARDLPRLRAYLNQLPQGLDSFPECRAKGSVFGKVYEFSEQRIEHLPPVLQALLERPPSATEWIPQCQALALIVAMVDARRLDSEAEKLWIREAATHLFASPMYRILMWAATPRMVFKSAHLRWSAFFRGTTLASVVFDRTATLILQAPPHMFNDDLARIFADVMYAAVNYTKEKGHASIELVGAHERGLEYRGGW